MKKLVIVLLFWSSAFGQTKFYLNLTASPGQAPTVNAGWNVTSGNEVRMASPLKDNSTIASTTSGNTGAAAVRKLLIKTFITQPLSTQNIALNSTVTGQIRGNMSSTSSRTGQGWIYIRLINPNGTVNGEIGNCASTSYTTTLTNRTYSLTIGSNIGVTAGMRICFEIGWNYQTGSNTTTTGTASFGSSSGVDLAADNITTTANNPFMTFSQTIGFQKPYKFFF